MGTLVADQRYETSDDTAVLPALPSSLFESLAHKAPEDSTPPAVDRNTAVLGPTLCFKGDVSVQEDFILQGRIEGSIHQAQRIVIASGGAVVGTIHARVVVVDGNVEGDLHGSESVTVHKTGRVAGNIFAPRVVLIDGAVFNGRIDMSGVAVVGRDGNQDANASAGKTSNATRVEPIDKAPTQKVVMVPPAPMRERAAS